MAEKTPQNTLLSGIAVAKGDLHSESTPCTFQEVRIGQNAEDSYLFLLLAIGAAKVTVSLLQHQV
jgi:hypothetical protein